MKLDDRRQDGKGRQAELQLYIQVNDTLNMNKIAQSTRDLLNYFLFSVITLPPRS